MPNKTGRAWKMTRATVHKKTAAHTRSNKYSKSDHDERPAQGTRGRVWVGGYDRSDGTHVDGHYRQVHRGG